LREERTDIIALSSEVFRQRTQIEALQRAASLPRELMRAEADPDTAFANIKQFEMTKRMIEDASLAEANLQKTLKVSRKDDETSFLRMIGTPTWMSFPRQLIGWMAHSREIVGITRDAYEAFADPVLYEDKTWNDVPFPHGTVAIEFNPPIRSPDRKLVEGCLINKVEEQQASGSASRINVRLYTTSPSRERYKYMPKNEPRKAHTSLRDTMTSETGISNEGFLEQLYEIDAGLNPSFDVGQFLFKINTQLKIKDTPLTGDQKWLGRICLAIAGACFFTEAEQRREWREQKEKRRETPPIDTPLQAETAPEIITNEDELFRHIGRVKYIASVPRKEVAGDATDKGLGAREFTPRKVKRHVRARWGKGDIPPDRRTSDDVIEIGEYFASGLKGNYAIKDHPPTGVVRPMRTTVV
jgi:hypothetical protein